MVVLLDYLWDGYSDFFERHRHPFLKDWPLTSSPLPVMLIVGSWLYFCTRCGPQYMRNRKPFELKNTIFLYNLAQILLNLALFYYGGIYGWFSRYSYKCQPIPYPPTAVPDDYKGAILVYTYFLVKLSDLLDTVFFVLRKKGNQVSTLHLYHHALMPIVAWAGVWISPGGHGTLVGWINSFVHVVMYTYYLIAGLGPEYQKYLWWKEHLTRIQLIQFCIIFVHNFTVLFRECSYPKVLNYLGIVESLVFIYMFGNFYYKSYVNKKENKRSRLNSCSCNDAKAKKHE